MFIHIQMFELYFLINYEFPNKFPSTRKLRADLIPYFNLLSKDKKTQRVERKQFSRLIDPDRCPNCKSWASSYTPRSFSFVEIILVWDIWLNSPLLYIGVPLFTPSLVVKEKAKALPYYEGLWGHLMSLQYLYQVVCQSLIKHFQRWKTCYFIWQF